jgi:hypothetical protein
MGVFKNASLCCAALFGVACSNERSNTLANQVVALGKPNAEYPAIAGARICVDARPELACATTDAQGFFTLNDVPIDTEIVLTIEKEGYVPSLKAMGLSRGDNVVRQPIVMFKMADLPADLGFDIDTKDSGIIDFFVFEFLDGGTPVVLPGVKVTLSPETEHGAVYFSEPGLFDPTLRATASYSGSFGRGNVGSGRFFNVPAGDYTLTFTAPEGYTCAGFTAPQAWGFPVPGKSAVRAPVREGYATYGVGMHCER